MRAVLFALVWSTSARQVHRIQSIQSNANKEGAGAQHPLKQLATLLQTFSPSAGWHGSGTGLSVTHRSHRVGRASKLQASAAPDVGSKVEPTNPEQPIPSTEQVKVYPRGCQSCEEQSLEMAEQNEVNEGMRLAQLHTSNISKVVELSHDYAQYLNDTLRGALYLQTDIELRSFQLNSSTEPTPLMQRVFNETVTRVPAEAAQFICAPEQAILLRTFTGMVRPRRLLDIGSFTGYSSSAILEAIPADAELTCLEIDRDYSRLAAEKLTGKKVNFLLGPAIDALRSFEERGEQFDFISMDADKPMHGEYFNASLRLLRPGGLIIMFGMILYPTPEDQAAMMKLFDVLPNETRIMTAQLPLGCGVQVIVKTEGLESEKSLTDKEKAEHKRWQLEAEITAIDRYLEGVGSPPAPELTQPPHNSLSIVARWDMWQQAEAEALAGAEAQAEMQA